MWLLFSAIILILLLMDLGIFNKTDHIIQFKESLMLSAFYISIGLLFGIVVWYSLGDQSGKSYFAGFLLEKTLSIDNIFVIALIFSKFNIPRIYQHRVLFWGIVGVMILRAILIGMGAILVKKFEFVLYLFSLFLIYIGFHLFFQKEKPNDVENLWFVRCLKKYLPFTSELHSNHFYIYDRARASKFSSGIVFTPLFLSLLTIEFTDLVFALDSVPAIFSITTDPFIVYTSNIFAVMGLRALYFALDGLMDQFSYLNRALALVLIFIGSKQFIAWGLGIEKIPVEFSLSVTIILITGGIFLSLLKKKKGAKH